MDTNCNCKRSGCTKNYCRCFDQKKLCSPNCGCLNCQNQMGSTSRSSLPATAVSTDTPSNAAPQSGRNRFFDEGEFDRCANSLMSTARMCLEQKVDKDTAHRRLLETFGGELDRLQRIVIEKKNQKM